MSRTRQEWITRPVTSYSVQADHVNLMTTLHDGRWINVPIAVSLNEHIAQVANPGAPKRVPNVGIVIAAIETQRTENGCEFIVACRLDGNRPESRAYGTVRAGWDRRYLSNGGWIASAGNYDLTRQAAIRDMFDRA